MVMHVLEMNLIWYLKYNLYWITGDDDDEKVDDKDKVFDVQWLVVYQDWPLISVLVVGTEGNKKVMINEWKRFNWLRFITLTIIFIILRMDSNSNAKC